MISIFISLLSGSLPALGAQEIVSDTRWTVTQSPYWIESDLIVKPGVTLTVEPGVEVRFKKINTTEGSSNRAEMIVQGTLLAVGTVDHPIRFTADTEMDEMGDWGGLILTGHGSRLEYVQIDHALTGLTIRAAAEIKWSKIEKNLETGILVGETGLPTLIGNEFTYNRVGLFLSGSGIVRENRFQSNSYGLLGTALANLTVEGNSFESNTYGIYLEAGDVGNLVQENLISSNDYGIYVDGGIPPRVHYNDLYNNRMYDFYHLSGSDADARYNWWGTTETALIDAYIYDQHDNTSPTTYGYVDYSQYLQTSALAPTILNLTPVPAALRSGVLTVTVVFSKEMAIQVKPQITYGRFDPYTTYTVAGAQGQWLSLTEYRFTLNVSEEMSEGLYRFRISGGESLDGQALKANIVHTFLVDRTPPTIDPGRDSFTFSPDGNGQQDQLEADVYFNEPAVLSYGIYQGGTVIYGPIAEPEYVLQKQILWDGRNNAGISVAEGEYELQMTARDQAGNQSALPVVVPVLLDLTPPVVQVNPLSGIQTGVVNLTGQVWDNTSPLTYISYRSKGSPDWVRLTQVEGNVTGLLYSWNLVGLTDGLYELKVETVDLAGNTTQVVLELAVDVNKPLVALDLPAPDAHLALEAVFHGRVADYYLSEWKLEIESNGVWTELAAGTTGHEGEMARLDIRSHVDGEYRIRLSATDQAGHIGLLEQQMYVDNATPPEVKGFNAGPAYLSPNGDGFADRLRFLISFSEKVYWEIGIFHHSGMKIRTLSGVGQTLESYWDGMQTDGTLAEDGSYSYKLIYSDQVGHLGAEQTGTVEVDTVAPLLQVNPLPTVTKEFQVSVSGQAADFAQILVNGKKVVVDEGQFTATVALVEGENQVSVIAEDLALNRAQDNLTVTCDTAPPQIVLDPVKMLTNRPEVTVSGRVMDANLTWAGVNVLNELGEKVTDLTLDEEQRFALDISLAVGVNQLHFEALDVAENRAECQVMVEYLPSIPEIYLLEPTIPYLIATDAQVVLKVLEGSVPLDPDSIRVELDGIPQTYQWFPATKQVVVELRGLMEREYLLTAEAANTKQEAGSGLSARLIVDLTDPLLTLTEPLVEEVLDGWEGEVLLTGSVTDNYLNQLTVTVTPVGGQTRVLTRRDLRGETAHTGELARWPVGEWTNGHYALEVTVSDLAGRQAKVQRMVEVGNTGLIDGRVQGELQKITKPVLYLVQGKQIQVELAFDPLTGEFAERVAVGLYDLALAPWGYEPVVLPGLRVKVGQTLSGLELFFSGEIRWNILRGKALVSIPFIQTMAPIGSVGKVIPIQGWDGMNYYSVKDLTMLKPGQGYWMDSLETLGLTVVGVPVLEKEYRKPLVAGWNLIGTPFNYAYPLEGLQFRFGGQTYSIATAKQTGKVDAGIWQYRGWYQRGTQLEPWLGYWLYADSAGEIIFSAEMADRPYKWPAKSLQVLNAASDSIQSPEWQVQIRASLGNEQDVENYFGTARGARIGLDQGLDLREPPGFAPYVSVYFSETGEEKLTTAYQPPVAGTKGVRHWQMMVESGNSGWVNLEWSIDPEAILHLVLTDELTGEEVDMLHTASYRFYQHAGAVRQFTLTARKGMFELKRVYNYANPFAATGPGRVGTRIRYLMTDDADVEVTIMDVVGRVVKRFPQMQAGKLGGQEGWNELFWNGQNGKGEPAANGAYIVKVKAYYGKKYYTKTAQMVIINGR